MNELAVSVGYSTITAYVGIRRCTCTIAINMPERWKRVPLFIPFYTFSFLFFFFFTSLLLLLWKWDPVCLSAMYLSHSHMLILK